jgi:SSS family solute:Na+ symporter
VFLLGILFRRVNGQGATAAVVLGFLFGVLMKVHVVMAGENAISIIVPFANQAIFNWLFCVIVCVLVSSLTPPPRPDQVGDNMTLNWRHLNILTQLGDRWYQSVLLWWGIFAATILFLMVRFSGLFS